MITEGLEIINDDCIDCMITYDDDMFDLSIVDPPYGIGELWKKDNKSILYKHESSYKNESIPPEEYFKQLFRVSVNQIIWGGNYFTDFLTPTNSWIFWDKKMNKPKDVRSQGELAWTSFNFPIKKVKVLWDGFCIDEEREGKHPHEKPIKLYEWVLKNYAEPGQTILDTHLGSGSSAIAAYNYGCKLTGIELEKTYFDNAVKRIEDHTAQKKLL